ncbi:family 43 glycosylhydrolase [uncultured Sunxiuqinia sp.]|jgi:xylan 1,4-beta-xylosidase|uniref:family 43 glycosylhydrolase n=1 Tax=uncultured Sunxiuqinia sp. TaxID=1573825 RepID=UPI0030D97117|tara:strand:+ start:2588 stop:4150 length:1563 start_codon:yes stop_codon:yes gene_type:complete
MKNLPLSTIVLLLFFQFSNAQQQTAVEYYQNPVIAGDFPDPTVIRVGDTYYAAGTSSDFAPNYPLYESTDLINWKHIGHIFNEPPDWTSKNFWAPELYYMNGTFYVYYTAKRKGDHVSCIGVATTTDIRKGFTDHGIIIEWGKEAIDAFVFRDDDDKLYISWKAYGLTEGRPIELLCSELSQDGLELVGEHFTLTDHSKGWQGAGDEGQCLVKHGDYYYHLYSVGGCCDNRCDYQVMVARSTELRGDWEQYPEPILQGGENWKCTGHGTLVSTPDNRYFYLYHSYHATDFEYIGRQGLLDELVWDEQTDWPKLRQGTTASVKAPVPFAGTSQKRETTIIDNFSSDISVKLWQWDLNLPKPAFKIAKGELVLSGTAKGLGFLGMRPRVGNYAMTTEVSNRSDAAKGICIYGNHQNYLAFGCHSTGLVIFQVASGKRTELATIATAENKPFYLKVEVQNGRYYRFFWSEDQTVWVPFGSADDFTVDGKFLPQWGVAQRAGLFVEGDDSATGRFLELKFEYQF